VEDMRIMRGDKIIREIFKSIPYVKNFLFKEKPSICIDSYDEAHANKYVYAIVDKIKIIKTRNNSIAGLILFHFSGCDQASSYSQAISIISVKTPIKKIDEKAIIAQIKKNKEYLFYPILVARGISFEYRIIGMYDNSEKEKIILKETTRMKDKKYPCYVLGYKKSIIPELQKYVLSKRPNARIDCLCPLNFF